MLYGPAGIGKTFAGLDLALTVASTAEEWHGHAIRPGAFTSGSVLYAMTEGAHGAARRLRAWRTAANYDGPLAIRFLDKPVHLGTLDDPIALVEAVYGATPEGYLDLFVLDTFSRCMAGLDENSARDASAVIASLDYVRRELGCCTLTVHHSGVAESRERGSTVFRGAVDTLLRLSDDDCVLVLTRDKQRDGAPLAPHRFRLAPVADTLVLVATNAATDAVHPLSRSAIALLHSLRGIATGDGCTCTEWEAASPVSRRAFFLARKALLKRGLVERKRSRYRLTAAG